MSDKLPKKQKKELSFEGNEYLYNVALRAFSMPENALEKIVDAPSSEGIPAIVKASAKAALKSVENPEFYRKYYQALSTLGNQFAKKPVSVSEEYYEDLKRGADLVKNHSKTLPAKDIADAKNNTENIDS